MKQNFTKIQYCQFPIWSANQISWVWISMEETCVKQLQMHIKMSKLTAVKLHTERQNYFNQILKEFMHQTNIFVRAVQAPRAHCLCCLQSTTFCLPDNNSDKPTRQSTRNPYIKSMRKLIIHSLLFMCMLAKQFLAFPSMVILTSSKVLLSLLHYSGKFILLRNFCLPKRDLQISAWDLSLPNQSSMRAEFLSHNKAQ